MCLTQTVEIENRDLWVEVTPRVTGLDLELEIAVYDSSDGSYVGLAPLSWPCSSVVSHSELVQELPFP